MVGLSALWMPIVVSAVFVFVALMLIHGLLGWHKDDMVALPGESTFRDALWALNLPPGDYRFPFARTTAEMTAPEFTAKLNEGPVGVISVWPNGEMNMGKMMGGWLVYSLIIAVFVAYITGRTHGVGASYAVIFRISGAVTFCCYAMAHWQNWIWWGKGMRFTLTHTLDALIFALVTAGTFGWLWPR
jgi:hypothetical protein